MNLDLRSAQFLFERAKLALNCYIGNDATASALAAFLSGVDTRKEDLLKLNTADTKSSLVGCGLALLEQTRTLGERNKIYQVFRDLGITLPQNQLIAFCGPSCVGKDLIASLVRTKLRSQGISGKRKGVKSAVGLTVE